MLHRFAVWNAGAIMHRSEDARIFDKYLRYGMQGIENGRVSHARQALQRKATIYYCSATFEG
jgi:hypothetical protein